MISDMLLSFVCWSESVRLLQELVKQKFDSSRFAGVFTRGGGGPPKWLDGLAADRSSQISYSKFFGLHLGLKIPSFESWKAISQIWRPWQECFQVRCIHINEDLKWRPLRAYILRTKWYSCKKKESCMSWKSFWMRSITFAQWFCA